jgi:hypothetical protein
VTMGWCTGASVTDPERRRKTTKLDSGEIARMAAAAEKGQCVECARRQATIEAQRLELHRAHKSREELEARVEIIGREVKSLATKVEELTK